MAIILVHLSDKIRDEDELAIRDFKMNSSAKRILPHLDYAIVRKSMTHQMRHHHYQHPQQHFNSDSVGGACGGGGSETHTHRMVLMWKDRLLYRGSSNKEVK